MSRSVVFLIGLFLVMGFVYRGAVSREKQSAAEFTATIDRLEAENRRLQARVRDLEAAAKAKPAAPAPAVPAPAPAGEKPKYESPPVRIVDVPPPNSPICNFATILNSTQLAHNLTWDASRGGTYVGGIPAGSIVEILYPNTYIWNDYPDEHALYVKVVESSAKPMIGQIGYIEMRRINFKQCNIGVDFEK